MGWAATGSRSASAQSLRLALGSLWCSAIALAAIEGVLFGAVPGQPLVVALFLVVAAIYVSTGVLAWARRPSNRMGALLCLSAFIVLAAGLQNTTPPVLIAVGLILGVAPIAAVFHTLLAFPSGRVARGLPLALVILGYVVTIVLQSPRYLFSHSPPPLNVLEIAHRPGLLHAGILINRWCGVAVLVSVLSSSCSGSTAPSPSSGGCSVRCTSTGLRRSCS